MCPVCSTDVDCQDEFVEERLTKRLLLEQDIDLDQVIVPQQIIASPVSLDDIGLKTPENQIIPEYEPSFKPLSLDIDSNDTENILKDIVSPKVSLTPEVAKINLSLDATQTSFTSKCVISVEGPHYRTFPDLREHDSEVLTVEMLHKLSEDIEDWKGFDLSSIGSLITFDYLEVGVSSDEFETNQCFLFEKCLLVLNLEGTKIEGTILLSDISSCVETNDIKIQLDLKTDILPLVYLKSNDKIIIKKWYHFLLKLELLKNDGEYQFDNNRIFQLSTNAWSLIERNSDLIPFEKLTAEVYNLSIPKPLLLPVSLVLCISLYKNDKSLSNDVYLDQLQRIIRKTLEKLSNRDSFGLVIIGKNPETGDFDCNGSFTGMASPQWEEWDEIIDELTVCDEQIFHDEYDQLIESLRHSVQLFASNIEFTDFKRVKKMFILSGSISDELTDEVPLEDKEVTMQNLIYTVIRKYGVELHSVLVSDHYSMKSLYYLSNSLKLVTLEEGLVRMTFGSRLNRVSSFVEAQDFIVKAIDELREVMIPHLEVTVSTALHQDVSLASFENITNGEMIDLTSHGDELQISIHNLKINECRNYLVNLTIDKQAVSQLGQMEETTLASTQGSWYNTLYETDVQISKLKVALNTKPPTLKLFSDTESLDELEDIEDLIILLPLVSSQREILYIKRDIEIIFLQNLIKSIENVNRAMIGDPISLIYGISKSCDGNTMVTVSREPVKFTKYVEYLCERGNQILELVENGGDREIGVCAGYDLCFEVALQ